MTQHDSTEANARLPELLQKAMPGETVVIAVENQLLVRLVPAAPVGKARVPGSAKGRIIAMAPDFGEPLQDFQDYT